MEFYPLLSLFGNMDQVDQVKLNFNQESVNMMNFAIAFIMFGVALSIRPEHFKSVFIHPKPVLLGVISQYIALPALTYLLVLIIHPSTPVAMGMILVAACPGGNVSNLISSLSKSNITLSVSLTTLTTVLSLIMTPLNFAFWGSLYAKHSPLLVPISIDPVEMFRTVFLILGIPVVLGMFIGMKYPKFAREWIKPSRWPVIFFWIHCRCTCRKLSHISGLYSSNFLLVLLHNGLAFYGYFLPKIFKVSERECRTISIETEFKTLDLDSH